MSVVQFDRSSNVLEMIDQWWFGHFEKHLDQKLISNYGFLAFVEDKPVFASFFYPLLGTELCMWGFQVANPASNAEERTEAIDELATVMSDFAKKLGYKIMVAYPGNKAIVKRLEKVGFVMGDEIVTQAFKELS